MTHEENVRESIRIARENAAKSIGAVARRNDSATTQMREELKIEKWESAEARESGAPPYEVGTVVVDTVRDDVTGEVISQEVVEDKTEKAVV